MTTKLHQLLRPVCHYCSQHRLESEVIRIPLEAGLSVVQCHYCFTKQQQAIAKWNDEPRFCCDECGVDLRPVEKNISRNDIKAYWEPKDGTWALMCEACSKPYEIKRRDLFRETPYGYRTGITK
jgi:hypothetical protein